MKRYLLATLFLVLALITSFAAYTPMAGTNRLYYNYTSDTDANWIETAADRALGINRVTSGRLGGTKPMIPLVLGGSNTALHLIVNTNGSVGILTNNPQVQLHVHGSILGISNIHAGYSVTVTPPVGYNGITMDVQHTNGSSVLLISNGVLYINGSTNFGGTGAAATIIVQTNRVNVGTQTNFNLRAGSGITILATNNPGDGAVDIGISSTATGGGESNYLANAGTTNLLDRFGFAAGKTDVTNLLKTIQEGWGMVFTNQDTNVILAVHPDVTNLLATIQFVIDATNGISGWGATNIYTDVADVWFDDRTDGLPGDGTSSNPYNGGGTNALDARNNFDSRMQQLTRTNDSTDIFLNIHLMPGQYYTCGYMPGYPYPTRTNAYPWFVKSGMRIWGGGMENTFLTLWVTNTDMLDNQAMHVMHSGPYSVTNAEVKEILIDCDLTNNLARTGLTNLSVGAVVLGGENLSIRRIHAINWGNNLNIETFVIGINCGTIATQAWHNIEGCIVDRPYFPTAAGNAVPIIVTGGGPGLKSMSGYIFNNYIDGSYPIIGFTPETNNVTGLQVMEGHNMIVFGNTIANCNIGLYMDTGGLDDVTIVANAFRNLRTGIYYNYTASPSNYVKIARVQNNIFEVAHKDNSGNAPTGIRITGSGIQVSNLIVSDNVFKYGQYVGTGTDAYAMYIHGVDNLQIHENTILDFVRLDPINVTNINVLSAKDNINREEYVTTRNLDSASYVGGPTMTHVTGAIEGTNDFTFPAGLFVTGDGQVAGAFTFHENGGDNLTISNISSGQYLKRSGLWITSDTGPATGGNPATNLVVYDNASGSNSLVIHPSTAASNAVYVSLPGAPSMVNPAFEIYSNNARVYGNLYVGHNLQISNNLIVRGTSSTSSNVIWGLGSAGDLWINYWPKTNGSLAVTNQTRIAPGTNVTVTTNGDALGVWTYTIAAAAGSGEANRGTNDGTGTNMIYGGTNGPMLIFNSLNAGTNIYMVSNNHTITINSTAAGGAAYYPGAITNSTAYNYGVGNIPLVVQPTNGTTGYYFEVLETNGSTLFAVSNAAISLFGSGAGTIRLWDASNDNYITIRGKAELIGFPSYALALHETPGIGDLLTIRSNALDGLVITNEPPPTNGFVGPEITNNLASIEYANNLLSSVGEHFYLYGSLQTNIPTIGTNVYWALTTPSSGGAVTNSITVTGSDQYFAVFVTTNTYYAVQGGAAICNPYVYEDTAGSLSFHAEFYMWDGTNLTELGTSPDQTVPTTLTERIFNVNIPAAISNIPVRFVVRFKSASVLLSPTIRMVTEGAYDPHLSLAVPAPGYATTNFVVENASNNVRVVAGTNATVTSSNLGNVLTYVVSSTAVGGAAYYPGNITNGVAWNSAVGQIPLTVDKLNGSTDYTFKVQNSNNTVFAVSNDTVVVAGSSAGELRLYATNGNSVLVSYPSNAPHNSSFYLSPTNAPLPMQALVYTNGYWTNAYPKVSSDPPINWEVLRWDTSTGTPLWDYYPINYLQDAVFTRYLNFYTNWMQWTWDNTNMDYSNPYHFTLRFDADAVSGPTAQFLISSAGGDFDSGPLVFMESADDDLVPLVLYGSNVFDLKMTQSVWIGKSAYLGSYLVFTNTNTASLTLVYPSNRTGNAVMRLSPGSPSDGHSLVYSNGFWTNAVVSGGSGTPGGSQGNVQVNSGSTFVGAPSLLYDETNGITTINSNLIVMSGASTSAYLRASQLTITNPAGNVGWMEAPPNPRYRRTCYWGYDGGTTLRQWGESCGSPTMTGLDFTSETEVGARFTTTASHGATVGFEASGNRNHRPIHQPQWEMAASLITTNHVRTVIGLTSTSVANTLVTNEPAATYHYALFRHTDDAELTSAQWVTMTRNGSTTLTNLTGITVNTNRHIFGISFITNATEYSVRFYIDGSNVTTHTASIPTANLGSIYASLNRDATSTYACSNTFHWMYSTQVQPPL